MFRINLTWRDRRDSIFNETSRRHFSPGDSHDLGCWLGIPVSRNYMNLWKLYSMRKCQPSKLQRRRKRSHFKRKVVFQPLFSGDMLVFWVVSKAPIFKYHNTSFRSIRLRNVLADFFQSMQPIKLTSHQTMTNI